MRNRFMRLVVFFDLPVITAAQRKSYRKFRKFLIKDGYFMMQESVYSKMGLDGSLADAAIARLKKNKPPSGLVQVLRVTEKQYAGIIEIVGDKKKNPVLDAPDRLVIL